MKKHITAFYLETLLLIVVFIGIILILTRMFGTAKELSSDAKLLTNSVCLAENAAEAFTASASPEELAGYLDENGNASATDSQVSARYDLHMKPDPNGVLAVNIAIREEGQLHTAAISVVRLDTENIIYSLDTAVHRKEAAP